MTYEDMIFKIPVEMPDYDECSNFVVKNIEGIIKDAISNSQNRIVINTNLKLGLPMENINKIAGPFVEAWAYETFCSVNEILDNKYALINVESQQRLNMADIVLQFKRNNKSITGSIDVKATAEDIISSGKSPNITSFSRIRTAYIEDPDYMFIVLSLKHKVYSQRNNITKLMDGIMEVVNYNAYDLKYISAPDISYNPTLGTGQIQIKDIHYVSYEKRTTWEFCQMLDAKYLNSARRTFETWYIEAKKYGWVKI